MQNMIQNFISKNELIKDTMKSQNKIITMIGGKAFWATYVRL